ncbi:hypothetical protein I317_07450 [Kwoniella heveanensis CBS 569]|nr:hypothetical protein I317_07450 [Kwoniella heveanensis CBS 569]
MADPAITPATAATTQFDPAADPTAAAEKGHHGVADPAHTETSHYQAERLRKRANPAPLGLFAFATTTLLFSLINAHPSTSSRNIAVGMSFAFGGLAQFVAGIFEFCVGNTFGMTAFCGYGAFSFAIAISYWPSSGVLTSYAPTPADPYRLNAALGLFLICWFVFTFLLWLASFRSTVGLCALFFFFWLSLLVLAIGFWRNQVGVIKAGGWMGIITSLMAYYVGAHSLLKSEAFPMQLPNPSLVREKEKQH